MSEVTIRVIKAPKLTKAERKRLSKDRKRTMFLRNVAGGVYGDLAPNYGRLRKMKPRFIARACKRVTERLRTREMRSYDVPISEIIARKSDLEVTMSESGQTTIETTEGEAPPKRWITRDEEAELRWYFRDGIGRLEQRSNMVAQLENAAFWFQHARPCKACGGQSARISKNGTVLREERSGSGFITSTDEWRKKAALARLLGHKLELPVDPVCDKCGGKGWVEGQPKKARKPPMDLYQWCDGPVTATTTGSSVKGNGAPETGGNDSLEKLGRLDKLLARLRRRVPGAYPVLESYYCPAGVERGLSSLWHLTPAGKTMLRSKSQGVTERQHFDSLSNAQERKPDPNRALQFAAADKQASELLEAARGAWTDLLDSEGLP